MSYVSLNLTGQTLDGFDSIIIVKDLGDIPCGVALDVTDVTDTYIKVGTLLVRDTANDVVKPLGITDGAYNSLESGYEYYGVLKSTILTSHPAAAVLRIGTVNAAAAEKYVGAPYPDAAVGVLNKIDFIYK